MYLKQLAGCYRLLTYFAVALVLTILVGGFLGGTFVALLHVPFHRVLDRLLLFFILAQLLLFEAPSFRRFWAGPFNEALLAEVGKGALLASLSVIAALLMGTTLGDWAFESGTVAVSKLGQVILALVLVPLIEETLFRGVALKNTVATSEKERTGLTLLAIALAALIYAAAHFVKMSEQFDHDRVLSATLAWQAEEQALMGLQSFPSWRGLNLWLIGVILGQLYLRYGRLWANLGAHAIWVLALLLLPVWLKEPQPGMDVSSAPWVTGPLVAIVLWELYCQSRVSARSP